jgi:hypothetical protein
VIIAHNINRERCCVQGRLTGGVRSDGDTVASPFTLEVAMDEDW